MMSLQRPDPARNAENANIFPQASPAPARDEEAKRRAKKRRQHKRAAATVECLLTMLRFPYGERAEVLSLWNRSDDSTRIATTAKKESGRLGTSRSSAGELLCGATARSIRIGVPVLVMEERGQPALGTVEATESLYWLPALDVIADRAIAERPKDDAERLSLCMAVADEHWPEWRQRIGPPPARPRPLTGIGQDVSRIRRHAEHSEKAVRSLISQPGEASVSAAIRSMEDLAEQQAEMWLLVLSPERRARVLNRFNEDPPEPENAQNAQNAIPQPEPEGYVTETPLSGISGQGNPSAETVPRAEIPAYLSSTVGIAAGGGYEPEVAEALAAVDVFTAAGAESFSWCLVDEDAKAAGSPHYIRGSSGKGRRLTADELRAALPALIEATYLYPWSLFGRPDGPLAQLDDIPEGIELPGTFAVVETSAESRQLWVAIAGVDPPTARRYGRETACKIGADPSASGSLRWPGSRNGKPGRGGHVVTLTALAGAQPTTFEELLDHGLVEAPQPRRAGRDPSPNPNRREDVPCSRRGWPDHDECLRFHGGDSFKADSRWCWLALDRGHEPDDVADRLLLVRERTDHKGTIEYARATVAAVLEAMGRAA